MKIERARPIYRVKTKQDRSRERRRGRFAATMFARFDGGCVRKGEGGGLALGESQAGDRARALNFFPLISSFRSNVLGSRLSAAAAADPFVTKICCDRRRCNFALAAALQEGGRT